MMGTPVVHKGHACTSYHLNKKVSYLLCECGEYVKVEYKGMRAVAEDGEEDAEDSENWSL